MKEMNSNFMLKVIIIIIFIFLFVIGMALLFLDDEENILRYPITNVVCTDQQVWDNRGEYLSFECDTSNLSRFPIARICRAKDVIVKDNKPFKIELNTTCIETCSENCEEGWRIKI